MASSATNFNQKPETKEEVTRFFDELAFLKKYKDFLGEETVSACKKYIENPPEQKSKVNASQAQKITLQHVKQTHFPPFELHYPPEDHKKVFAQILADAELIDEIASSQYNVTKIILANPDAIVLHEGCGEDLTPEVAERLKKDPESEIAKIKKEFSNGLPDKFDQLTEIQKRLLAYCGGARVLFALGIISHVYKSTTKEDEEKTISEYQLTHDMRTMLEPREQRALFWAKQAALKSGKNRVLLIYGANHDFERFKDAQSKEGIEILKSIETETFAMYRTPSIPKLRPFFAHDSIPIYSPSGPFFGSPFSMFNKNKLGFGLDTSKFTLDKNKQFSKASLIL